MDGTKREQKGCERRKEKKSQGKKRGNGWEGVKREEKRENDLGSMKDGRGVKE